MLGLQGCQDGGICYPPMTRRLAVSLPAGTVTPAAAIEPSEASDAAVAPDTAGVAPPAEAAKMQAMMGALAREVREHVEQNFDYVGDAFAREARDIHEGRSEKREIYGEATPAEVKKLKDDGVPVAPLPALPPDPAKAH